MCIQSIGSAMFFLISTLLNIDILMAILASWFLICKLTQFLLEIIQVSKLTYFSAIAFFYVFLRRRAAKTGPIKFNTLHENMA